MSYPTLLRLCTFHTEVGIKKPLLLNYQNLVAFNSPHVDTFCQIPICQKPRKVSFSYFHLQQFFVVPLESERVHRRMR